MNMLKEIWYLQSIEASWSHPFAVQGSQTAQVPNAPQWIGVLLWCYSRCGFCMSQNIHDPVDGDRMWQIVCQFVISLSIVQLYLICFFLKTYQMKACAKRTRYWQCEAPGALSNSHVKSLLSNAALCTIFLIDTLFCPHTKLCCLQDFSIVTCPMPREGKNTQWPPNLSNKSMECV